MVLLMNEVETTIDGNSGETKSKEVATEVSETKKSKKKQGKIESQPDMKKHRKRVKERYLKNGASEMKDYEMLEMMLFFCVQRKDTKALAKKLILDFGSFARVLEADAEELVKYQGITMNGVVLLKSYIDASVMYGIDKMSHIDKIDTFKTSSNICEYFKRKLFGSTKEYVYIMFLDSRYKLISCDLVGEGDLTSVHFKNSNIIELALKYKAKFIAMAHTHPDGSSLPSHSDVITTAELKKHLSVVDVGVLEHVIVTPKECISMFDGGYLI